MKVIYHNIDHYGRLDSRLHPREAGIFRLQMSIPERCRYQGWTLV